MKFRHYSLFICVMPEFLFVGVAFLYVQQSPTIVSMYGNVLVFMQFVKCLVPQPKRWHSALCLMTFGTVKDGILLGAGILLVFSTIIIQYIFIMSYCVYILMVGCRNAKY